MSPDKEFIALRARQSQALAALSDGHPAWITIHALLDSNIDLATEGVCDTELTPEKRIYQAGYLAHARDFNRHLAELRREGIGAPEKPQP